MVEVDVGDKNRGEIPGEEPEGQQTRLKSFPLDSGPVSTRINPSVPITRYAAMPPVTPWNSKSIVSTLIPRILS